MSEHHGTRVYFLFGVLALGLFGVAVVTIGVQRVPLPYVQAGPVR